MSASLASVYWPNSEEMGVDSVSLPAVVGLLLVMEKSMPNALSLEEPEGSCGKEGAGEGRIKCLGMLAVCNIHLARLPQAILQGPSCYGARYTLAVDIVLEPAARIDRLRRACV